MALEHITTIADDGVALFIGQFKEKPRLEAWTRSFLNRCQELEDVLWDVIDSRQLDNAHGAQLDTIGKLVGQPRVGADDEAYRVFIRVRVRVNRSTGTFADVATVALLATDGQDLVVYEYYPASVVVDVLDPISIDPASFAEIISQTVAAGVGSSLHFSDDGEFRAFTLSDTDFDDPSPNQGLSDDAELAGGLLIGAI